MGKTDLRASTTFTSTSWEDDRCHGRQDKSFITVLCKSPKQLSEFFTDSFKGGSIYWNVLVMLSHSFLLILKVYDCQNAD